MILKVALGILAVRFVCAKLLLLELSLLNDTKHCNIHVPEEAVTMVTAHQNRGCQWQFNCCVKHIDVQLLKHKHVSVVLRHFLQKVNNPCTGEVACRRHRRMKC